MWLEKLKEMKRLSGKTSQQISDETNIPKSTIDKLFSGQTKEPYLNSTRAIVHCLGYTLDDLVEYGNTDTLEITEHEQSVILAYRSRTDMQKAVDTLLGLVPNNVIEIKSVARSADNHGMYKEKISKEDLQNLQSQQQPSSDDEL